MDKNFMFDQWSIKIHTKDGNRKPLVGSDLIHTDFHLDKFSRIQSSTMFVHLPQNHKKNVYKFSRKKKFWAKRIVQTLMVWPGNHIITNRPSLT